MKMQIFDKEEIKTWVEAHALHISLGSILFSVGVLLFAKRRPINIVVNNK